MPGLERPAKKTILWLDGRPASLKVVKDYIPLLSVQGIEVVVPPGTGSQDGVFRRCDVAVAPPIYSPEHGWSMGVLERMKCDSIISDESPLKAIFRALAHPWELFMQVVFGVDPGYRCAAVAIADGIVVWTWKGRCGELGKAVVGILEFVPSSSSHIYLGSGPAFEEAEESLIESGIEYTIVEEWGSTSKPYSPPGSLYRMLEDKDLLASLTIAYRGLSGWRWRVLGST